MSTEAPFIAPDALLAHWQGHRRLTRRVIDAFLDDQLLSFSVGGVRANPHKGPIVLVWDMHPIHRRRKVQDFLACHRRIHVYEFPTSAPELNPTEFMWTQISKYTASTAPHNNAELRANVFAGIARTRRSRCRLWACVFASDLPWKW